MAHYYHTRDIRKQRTNDELELQKKMVKRVKDFDEGIIPNIIDGRTKAEKLQSKAEQNELIRKLVYNLFDNDPEYSEEYIQLLKRENIDLDLFQAIYDDLEKRFKGKNITPETVFNTTKELGETFLLTGNTVNISKNQILNKLDDIKEEVIKSNYKTEYEKQDNIDKLDAIKYLYNNIFNNNAEKIGIENFESFKSIKDKISNDVNELIKLFDEPDMDENTKMEMFLDIIKSIKGETILEAQRMVKLNK